MSIVLKTLVIDGIGTECKIIQIDTAEDYKHFQKMVNQGTNLWPDAPAVIKSFADMVTSGKVHQPYSDDPVPTKKAKNFSESFKKAAGLEDTTPCNHLFEKINKNSTEAICMHVCTICRKAEPRTNLTKF